jgi:hypothetical protein
MGQKRSELSSSVWISRFWAQYSSLPEPLKKGFVSLAENMEKNADLNKTGRKTPSTVLRRK